MVGKLQDVVSAAVVVGATEKVQAGQGARTNNAGAFDTPAATVENAQSRFVVDTKGVEAQTNQQQQQAEEPEFDIKPGSIDEKTLDNITQELNKLMSRINANLNFNYHQDAGVMSVRMVDKETGDIIKELPPEEMVKNMVKSKIWIDAFIGTFVDKTA